MMPERALSYLPTRRIKRHNQPPGQHTNIVLVRLASILVKIEDLVCADAFAVTTVAYEI